MMVAANAMLQPSTIDPADFRAAMRELASGVAVIAAGVGTRRRGITATAVCSLSAEPPALLVCVNRDAECHKTILEYRSFCVNLLASESEALANIFAGRTGQRGVERFASGHWTTLATGAPVLREAISSFDCALRQAINAGTHSIFVGDVEAVTVRSSRSALVYRAGRFASVG